MKLGPIGPQRPSKCEIAGAVVVDRWDVDAVRRQPSGGERGGSGGSSEELGSSVPMTWDIVGAVAGTG